MATTIFLLPAITQAKNIHKGNNKIAMKMKRIIFLLILLSKNEIAMIHRFDIDYRKFVADIPD